MTVMGTSAGKNINPHKNYEERKREEEGIERREQRRGVRRNSGDAGDAEELGDLMPRVFYDLSVARFVEPALLGL